MPIHFQKHLAQYFGTWAAPMNDNIIVHRLFCLRLTSDMYLFSVTFYMNKNDQLIFLRTSPPPGRGERDRGK